MNVIKTLVVLQVIYTCVLSLSFTVTSRVFMEVEHKKKFMGRIVFGLFGERSPKAVTNFRHICMRGINGSSYVGTGFHRVINRFLVQGGDIVHKDGTGSMSIYGEYFEDEAMDIEHNRPGYVGMANRGPNTNGCQFYVTTVAAQWLNGKHTVFGKVIEGMDVIWAIEDVKTDSDDHPIHPVVIANCGDIPTEPYEFYPDDFSIIGWIKAAGLPFCTSFIVLMVFHYFFRQLNMYC